MYSFAAENNTSKEYYSASTPISILHPPSTTANSNSSLYAENIYNTTHRNPFNDMLYSLENQHQNQHQIHQYYNQQHYHSNNFDSQQHQYEYNYDLTTQQHYYQPQQPHFDLNQSQSNQWSCPQQYYYNNNHPHHSQSHIHDTPLYTLSQNSSSHSLPSQTTPNTITTPTSKPTTTTTTTTTTQQRPRITTSIWDDEGTICYQVDVRGICVARRQDNDMINGTKLLNVTGMSRGKRDGILKNERGRVVVKVGAMHLKGVWVPFARAKSLAIQYNILDQLHPLFVDEPAYYFYQQHTNPPIYLQQQQSDLLYVPSVPSMIPFYNNQEPTQTTLSPHSSSITVSSLPPFI